MKHIIKLAVGAILLSVTTGGHGVKADEVEQSVYLTINFDVRPDKQAEFEQIMQSVGNAMKSEAGFEEAFVFLDSDYPNRFVLIERWKTRELHRTHYDHIVASGDWAHILGLLTGEPTLTYSRLFAH